MLKTSAALIVLSVLLMPPPAEACSRPPPQVGDPVLVNPAELIFMGKLKNSRQSEHLPHDSDTAEFTFAKFEVTHWVKGAYNKPIIEIQFANWPISSCGIIFDYQIGDTLIVFASPDDKHIYGWFEPDPVLAQFRDPIIQEYLSDFDLWEPTIVEPEYN